MVFPPNKKIAPVYAVFIIFLLAVGAVFLTRQKEETRPSNPQITNFEECVAAGYPVQESYPRGCNAGGQHFVEDIGNANEKADLITIHTPRPGDVIKSPLTIRGSARGTWFFEATFPVVLTDWDGKIIAEGYAEATGDWMTEDFVTYTATVEFENPSWDQDFSKRGSLILQKSNPSGLPQNDDALEIPIKFE